MAFSTPSWQAMPQTTLMNAVSGFRHHATLCLSLRHKVSLSRCALFLSWAIMGNHWRFLTTDYNVWFLEYVVMTLSSMLARSVFTISTWRIQTLRGDQEYWFESAWRRRPREAYNILRMYMSTLNIHDLNVNVANYCGLYFYIGVSDSNK